MAIYDKPTAFPNAVRVKFDFDFPGWDILADQVLGPCSCIPKKWALNKNKLIKLSTKNLGRYKSLLLNSRVLSIPINSL
jgi:hypothetical protein